MPDEPLSSLVGPFTAFIKSISTRAKRLHAERRAGQVWFETENTDFINNVLGDTLTRLRGETIDDVWWKELLTLIEHPFITPNFLQLLFALKDRHNRVGIIVAIPQSRGEVGLSVEVNGQHTLPVI